MSTKVIDLLFKAKQEGIEILLHEGQLHVRLPKQSGFDKSILEELKNNKPGIIEFLERQVKTEGYENIPLFDRQQIKDVPLSFSQERLWFIHNMEGSLLYHLPTILRLRGRLNREALSKALQEIVLRHEVLRTVFIEKEGRPYQVIRDAEDWKLDLIEGATYKEEPEGLQQYIAGLAKKPFDLSKDFMLRGALIRLSEQEHVVVVTMHHIASDAWSMPIIVREVMELYRAYDQGETPGLKPLDLQYADYSVWQRNYLQGEVLDKKLGYWKNKLGGVEPLGMPTDYPRPAVRSSRGASQQFRIEKELTGKLQQMSQQTGASLFMTLLSAYNILLYRYSGQSDIAVGTSIANRSRQEVEALIGFFVNTLTLRSELSDDISFSDLLSKVKATTMEAYEHQDVPFEKVVEAVVKERDPGRSPLFQVMLVLINTPESEQLQLGELQLSREPFVSNVSKFDITFFINESGGVMHGAVEYSTDIDNAETISGMIAHFKALLESAVSHPQEKIGRLKMLTEAEEEAIKKLSGETKVYAGDDQTVISIFEEQVSKTPEAIALVFEREKVTYGDLNQRANGLADTLISSGVKQGDLVPLLMERGSEMITAILGIMKAGAGYVPVDTSFPEDRIAFMLEDSKAKVVVTTGEASSKLPSSYQGEQIDLNNIQQSTNNAQGLNNDQQTGNNEKRETRNVKSGATAYVIYTSGSTGQPKGVMVSHRNLVDYTLGLEDKTRMSESRSFALVSTIATDLGNTVIYASLLSGGELHLFSKEQVSDSAYLIKYFRDKQIGCVKIVPSHWKALSSTGELLLPQQMIVFGGEALGSDLVELIKETGSKCRIINHYGPTETTIGKLLHEVEETRKYGKTIPIGKAFSNTKVYVLSKDLQLSPVGVPGQLFIAGDGVAKGYLNNEALTKEKFVQDPFGRDNNNNFNNNLMYATGDRVRMLEDGSIEFMGRVDTQVKIRGYRIEPGEVETVLGRSDLVSQGVVVARADRQGNMQLVAYVVPAEDSWFDRESILDYLKQQLPEYMVPQVVMELEAIPLTANGKVDRKALPDPDTTGGQTGKYEAPRNEAEEKLARIWQEVLEVEEVGINDDFFELGGHSLLAVRLISAIRKELSVEMPISDIFDYPTIAKLSGQLEQKADAGLLPKVKASSPRPERIPLSFSQERLWFIDRLEGSVQYHVPAVLRLKGRVNAEAIEHALGEIVSRHEVLRTVFKEEDGEAFQQVKERGSWQLKKTNGNQEYSNNPGEANRIYQRADQQTF